MADTAALRDSVRTWVNRRRRGGFKKGEAFTAAEVSKAFPSWSRSQVWRVLTSLVKSGHLSAVRDGEDSRMFRYSPTEKWDGQG